AMKKPRIALSNSGCDRFEGDPPGSSPGGSRRRCEAYRPGSRRNRETRIGWRSVVVVTATAAAVAATAAAVAAATAPSPAARSPRASFIDREATAVVILAVQALDSRQGLIIIDHLDEAESPAPSR